MRVYHSGGLCSLCSFRSVHFLVRVGFYYKRLSHSLLFILFIQFRSCLHRFSSTYFIGSGIRGHLSLHRVLYGVSSFLPFFEQRTHFSRITRRRPRTNVVAVRVMRGTKHVRVLRQSFKRRLYSLFRHAYPTKGHGRHVTRLSRLNLPFNRVLYSSRLHRTVILGFPFSGRLQLCTNRLSTHDRCAIHRYARRTTSKPTMSRHVPTLPSPTPGLPRNHFRYQDISFIYSGVGYGIREISFIYTLLDGGKTVLF